MSTVPPAPHRPRRRLAAAGASVALFLVSVVAVAWPGAASATGYGETRVELVKNALQDGIELDGTTPLVPGDTFDYVITVTNTGSTKARTIKVTDDLPSTVEPAGEVTVTEGGTIVAATPGEDPVTVTIASLSPGDSRVVTIPVRIVDDAKGCSAFTNSASATYVHGYGEEFTSESNELTLSVGCADLTIEKVADVDGPVAVGDSVTFDIAVALADVSYPVTVKPVVITDDIDLTRFAFVSASDGGTYAGGVVTWTLADGLAPGDPPTTVSVTLRILPSGQDPSPDYTNTACVALSAGDETPVVKPGDDCDEATVSTGSVDLSLDKLVNGVSTTEVAVGDAVTYTLTVSNAGPDGATGVVVEDALPAGVTFVEQTGGDGTLSADGATWTVGDVAANGTASVTFTATVDEAGEHTNVAEVSVVDQTDTDSTPGNGCEGTSADEDDCAEATVVATEAAGSLSIVKANDPTGVVAFGTTITYTLSVSVPATDTQPQMGVVVTDTIPGYDPDQPTSGTATYVDGSASCLGEPPAGGTCVVITTLDGTSTTGLTWALGTMSPGETRQVQFAVTVDKQDAVVAGSETVDFVNVAAVGSDTQPSTPSNEVVNTTVITEVSGEELADTGSQLPLAELAFVGLLLVALGVLVVRHPALAPISPYRGRHAAR